MKSGFWQIQIAEKDRYKTAFVVPFGHYEWNVMPFGLKNAPSEFQNIMNEIFNQSYDFIIVDVLIFKTVKPLPCLVLDDLKTFKIAETNTTDIGYGGILKHSYINNRMRVRYTSETWNTQFIHSFIQ